MGKQHYYDLKTHAGWGIVRKDIVAVMTVPVEVEPPVMPEVVEVDPTTAPATFHPEPEPTEAPSAGPDTSGVGGQKSAEPTGEGEVGG